MPLVKSQKKTQNVNLKVNLNQHVTARTANKCVHITVHYWSTQYSAGQF